MELLNGDFLQSRIDDTIYRTFHRDSSSLIWHTDESIIIHVVESKGWKLRRGSNISSVCLISGQDYIVDANTDYELLTGNTFLTIKIRNCNDTI